MFYSQCTLIKFLYKLLYCLKLFRNEEEVCDDKSSEEQSPL